MYSKLPQNDSQNDMTPWPEQSPLIELQQNNTSLQRHLRQLKIWNYFLGLCTALCIGLLAFSHRPASLRNGSKETSLVPESEFLSAPFPPCCVENDRIVSTVPTMTTFFDRDDVYANHSDPAADEAWAALMPVRLPKYLKLDELD